MLGKPESECNLVICHLGAGSSMCAVQASGGAGTRDCLPALGVTVLCCWLALNMPRLLLSSANPA